MEPSSEKTTSVLQQMDANDFEYFIADLWSQQGWNTTVTQASADRGIDVIAERTDPFHQKHIIQAKRYSSGNKVGSPDVQQYSSLLHQEDNVDAVIIVTTSSFSNQAEEVAKDLNIKLINGERIHEIIKEANAGYLLRKYTELNSNDSQGVGSIITDSSNTKEGSSSQSIHYDQDEPVRVHNSSAFDVCPVCGDGNFGMNLESQKKFSCPDCGAVLKQNDKNELYVTNVGTKSSALQAAAGSEANLKDYTLTQSMWNSVAEIDDIAQSDLEDLQRKSNIKRYKWNLYKTGLITIGIGVNIALFVILDSILITLLSISISVVVLDITTSNVGIR